MLSYLRAQALNRGLRGGSQLWVGIGAVVWTIRLFQWISRPETTVIYRDRLEPGQAVVIRHEPPGPTRRQAKKSAERARKEAKKAKKAARVERRAAA